MQKIEIFITSILFFLVYSSCSNSAHIKQSERQLREVTADSLIGVIRSGNPISLNNCRIQGRFTYHGRVNENFGVIDCIFDSTLDFSNAIFAKGFALQGSILKDSVSFDNARFGGQVKENRFINFTKVEFRGPAVFSNIQFFRESFFNDAIFKEYVNFANTTFSERVEFWGTKFEGYADFVRVTFSEYAGFTDANFVANSEKRRQNATGSFGSAELLESNFADAQLSKVIMQPDTISEFSMSSLAFAHGLQDLKFYRPEMLSRIKSFFRLNHYRQAEREITCAIKRHDQNLVETIAFDYTSEYGSNFVRPFQFFLGIWLLCSIIYFLFFKFNKKYQMIISITFLEAHYYKFQKNQTRSKDFSSKFLSNLKYSMLFSLSSSFNIGFRDFNFGRIIKLLLPEELDFQPTGILRTISAIQAIFSVFLIGLWILSYFGRPFD